jgi:lipoprotein-anchoring transpeptidase ErfK/SrfK
MRGIAEGNHPMNTVGSRNGWLASGALLALVVSGAAASAQYYPPSPYGYNQGYPPAYRGYGYDRPFNRNFDSDRDLYLRRRPPLARDNDDDMPVRPRKSKPERFDEPKEVANKTKDKPLKGPYHIVVSINTQRVSLYGADGLIRTSGVSTGMRGHPTPMGVFTVIGKERFHRSNIYSNAPMPFMQRITWSGVALHEGVLPGYPASHGCIRMGSEFAVFMWNTTKIGSRVIVTQEEPAPVSISSLKLFTPPPAPRAFATAAAAGDGKTTIAAAKNAVRAADEPILLVMQNDGPDAAAQTPFTKPKIDAYRNGPVSVFVSRKTGKLYVRYDYEPLFEAPVTIKNPDRPLGTHVYTAMEATNSGMRWSAISIPTPTKGEPVAAKPGRKGERQTAALNETDVVSPESREAQSPLAALARIEMPKEAVERIASILSVGSSLTVSDYGISEETGRETDFIILTK